MSLFAPRRADGKAEWRVAYEQFVDADYGTIVPMEDLAAALDVSLDGDRQRIYAAVRRASRELRLHNRRSVGSVPGFGYRVLKPEEHELQERSFRKKSQRQLSTALAVNTSTALEQLDEAARRQTVERRGVLQSLVVVLRNHDRRLDENQRMIESVYLDTKEKLEQHDREIKSLKRVLGEGAE